MTLNHVLDCLNHSLEITRVNGFIGHFVSVTSVKSCGFSSYKNCEVKIYFNSKTGGESKLICSINKTSKISDSERQDLVNTTEQEALYRFFRIITNCSTMEKVLNGLTG